MAVSSPAERVTDFATSYAWEHDPKHLAFSMARYHFIARMLQGFDYVIEVGAGDGVQSRIVERAVKTLVKTDKDSYSCLCWNPVEGPFKMNADAIYALDVLEHVDPEEEQAFMEGVWRTIKRYGTLILGLPSKESQVYASPESKREHVNCKTEEELRALCKSYFHSVYLFGMNDTTLHVGFGALCHYRIALCTSPIR